MAVISNDGGEGGDGDYDDDRGSEDDGVDDGDNGGDGGGGRSLEERRIKAERKESSCVTMIQKDASS